MKPTQKFILASLTTATFSTALLAGLDDNPMVQMIKFLFKPFAEQAARNTRAEQFREKNRTNLVITNESSKTWKFGCTDLHPGELKGAPSGTMKVARVKADGLETYTPEDVAPGSRTVEIPSLYGVLTVTPVCAKNGWVTWQKFARVCFLEDEAGKRIYLTLTKDTPGNAVPEVGVAGVSNKILIDQKAIHFTDRTTKNFNMVGIQVDQLK